MTTPKAETPASDSSRYDADSRFLLDIARDEADEAKRTRLRQSAARLRASGPST